ncbi:MAG: enoyl-[acyl-carrier-protein] reductase FabL [Caldilineaceae bacterium]|nr:enoyl-[acyl-carrier-protein] reductase FabL [Caldilineaceae bacterium]
MQTLSGKTAIITGSGRGIGRGIALALAQRGCQVTINYLRKREAAEETVAAIEQIGGKAIAVKANIAQEDEIQRMVDETVAVFGGVEIFVGNAASGVLRPMMDLERRHWDWTMDINARSILIGAQATVPFMRRSGWGRILSVTSFGSRRVLPEYSVVGVSKAAVEAVTRYLAVELAPDNIIANCISPGVVITGALDFFPSKAQIIEQATERTPTRRLVTPEDVGELAAWLCSDAASMIVGQTIEIDGGYSLLA